MRYVPEIQFDAENVDIELCTKSALKDVSFLIFLKLIYYNLKPEYQEIFLNLIFSRRI